MSTRSITAILLFIPTTAVVQPSRALAAEADVLHAGTSNPGRVYAYRGGSTWEPISETLGYAVLDLIEFDNHLYAATMSTSNPELGVGSVWRHDAGRTWRLVTTNMDDQVCDLIEWNGNLYAGTAWRGGKLYRLNGARNQFEFLDYADGWSGIRAMYVWKQPWIQLGDIWWDKFGRYDGSVTYEDLEHYDGSCVYDFASYDDVLYAAAYRGRVYRSVDGINWSMVKDRGDYNLWEIESFQGYLYMGDNGGVLSRMTGHHKKIKVWSAPDSIISMLADGDDVLYFGTGGEAGALYQSSTTGEGCVYAYSGSGTPELISDLLGAGVQCLCKTAPGLAVHTLDATLIGQTSTTLRGRLVDDRGETCWYRFHYWRWDDTYVSTTSWTGNIAAGDVFSEVLTGLMPGSRYYFWAQVENSFGECDWDSGVEDFTTLAGPVELYSPNGGEFLLAGETCTIEWRAEPTVTDVVIEYSLDNGASWNPIAAQVNIEANYRYCWDIPSADSQHCLVCVSDLCDPNKNDVSDDLFTVTALVVPNVQEMTQEDAAAIITSTGLIVGAITHSYTDSVPAGSVISQQPAANAPALVGSAVDLCLSAGAEAEAAPEATTESATSISSNGVMLNGRITDDGGGGCKYRFRYWKSGAMWIRRTSWVGYAVGGQTFSQVVPGLAPGSRYYFWAEARNTAGKSGGWDSGVEVFKTGN